jgi:MFS family permease
MCVIMKIDLVGPKSRGLAVGLNEFAGYFMVGFTAFATGWIASEYGSLRPEPFYLGIGYAVFGLIVSIFFVRDTGHHVKVESSKHAPVQKVSFKEVFLESSFKDRNLFAASQAGLVNNLNDGMNWAIFPLFFVARGLGVEPIGILKAVYPGVWGIMQTLTGPISDRIGRKGLIVSGMWVQAIALLMVPIFTGFKWWLLSSILLGIGTAMVYPTLIASVSDASHPSWRARSLSIYRFWRDLGYAIGALLAGSIGDIFGLSWAIASVGILTFASGLVVAIFMQEKS